MKRPEIAALIAGSGLPEELKAYLACALRRGRPFSFTAALKKEPAGFLAAVTRLLAGASAALGRPAGEVLFATGFEASNLAPHRLEAALAELLAVLLLREQGFSELRLIGTNSGRTADISGSKDGLRWAFEVRCLSAGKKLDGELLGGKFDRKLPQASNAIKKYGFDRAGVVLAREPWRFADFEADPGLAALAEAARPPEKRQAVVHLCLADRGRFGVYPRW